MLCQYRKEFKHFRLWSEKKPIILLCTYYEGFFQVQSSKGVFHIRSVCRIVKKIADLIHNYIFSSKICKKICKFQFYMQTMWRHFFSAEWKKNSSFFCFFFKTEIYPHRPRRHSILLLLLWLHAIHKTFLPFQILLSFSPLLQSH